ncbi:MAG: inositol monophosphatase family protein [Patescibacteria group bacterium]
MHCQPIEKIGVRYAVTQLLPILWIAGDIAKRLQPAVIAAHRCGGGVPQKDGGRFTAALTDADVIIGTMVGAHILTMFNDATFEDEEWERDRISAYFPEKARYRITLDPIDGTLYYLNNLPLFAVVVTILDEKTIVAAVVHLPIPGMFYIGIAGDGAFTTTSQYVRSGLNLWEPFKLCSDPPSAVLCFRHDETIRRALATAEFQPISSQEYQEGEPWNYSAHSVLTGDACGVVQPNAPLRDWGASGFIAGLAGGKTNDPFYDPMTLRTPLMIVGASPKVYDQINKALGIV